MKVIAVVLVVFMLSGCGYATRVDGISDHKLCSNLGIYTERQVTDGITLSNREINARNLDFPLCEKIADDAVIAEGKVLKTRLCQNLAAFRIRGNLDQYLATMDKIKAGLHFDKECKEIAQFYNIRLRRDRLESEKIELDFAEAADKPYKEYAPIVIQKMDVIRVIEKPESRSASRPSRRK